MIFSSRHFLEVRSRLIVDCRRATDVNPIVFRMGITITLGI